MIYSQMVVFVEGAPIYQQQEMEIDEPNNDADVDTVMGGRVGVAPGPDVTTISITAATPVAGSDFDWEQARAARAPVTVKVQQIGATKFLQGKFLVRSFNQRGGTGQPVLQNISLSSLGSPAPRFQ